MATAAEKLADETIRNALELAERKVSLFDMIGIVDIEAHQLESSMRARLLAGVEDEPHWEQVERVRLLLAVKKFLEQHRDQPEKVIDWLRRRGDAAA